MGFSARSIRHCSLFGDVKIGASATLMAGGGRGGPIFARSKSEKCFKPAERPTETLAMQAKYSKHQQGRGTLAVCHLPILYYVFQ